MESEGSVLCSQGPAIGPSQSTLSILILSSYLLLGLPNGLFP